MKKFFVMIMVSVFLVTFQENCLAEKLENVLDWYSSQKKVVKPLLQEQLGTYSIKISDVNINSCWFSYVFLPKPRYKGERPSECMYKLEFSCKVGGWSYLGKATGFMKYWSNNIEWIFCEIYSSDGHGDWITLTDKRREYSEVMDSYCRHLLNTYGSKRGKHQYSYVYSY